MSEIAQDAQRRPTDKTPREALLHQWAQDAIAADRPLPLSPSDVLYLAERGDYLRETLKRDAAEHEGLAQQALHLCKSVRLLLDQIEAEKNGAVQKDSAGGYVDVGYVCGSVASSMLAAAFAESGLTERPSVAEVKLFQAVLAIQFHVSLDQVRGIAAFGQVPAKLGYALLVVGRDLIDDIEDEDVVSHVEVCDATDAEGHPTLKLRADVPNRGVALQSTLMYTTEVLGQ